MPAESVERRATPRNPYRSKARLTGVRPVEGSVRLVLSSATWKPSRPSSKTASSVQCAGWHCGRVSASESSSCGAQTQRAGTSHVCHGP